MNNSSKYTRVTWKPDDEITILSQRPCPNVAREALFARSGGEIRGLTSNRQRPPEYDDTPENSKLTYPTTAT
uniref:MSP domain-containing protein n=1 Tax=Steinernema glaseri TaxID=37863 RepID=A0A1I7Z674_9BILA